MSNYVYTTHPDVYSYAREPGWLDCLGAEAIRQGNHYILWFAFGAWLGLIFSATITRTYKSFNIIAVIRLPISYAFCATRHPHPPEKPPAAICVYNT